MFKKPHDVGLSKKHALGGKDVKNFRNDVLKRYASITDDIWQQLFPDKVVLFIKLNSGTFVWENADGNPIFFDPSGHLDLLIPTIYALCVVPDLIPCVVTNSSVSETMLRGADLFLQGCLAKDFLKDQVRSVMIPGNPVPFAVGKMALSYAQALENKMEGRGLINLHYYGDQLFNIGDKRAPNEGFSGARILPSMPLDEEHTEEEEIVNQISEVCINDETPLPDEKQGHNEEENQEKRDDEIIWLCALGALHSTKKSDLPMSVNDFYNLKMMQMKPPEIVSLDMKKSKWKRVSKLLEDMEEQGLLVLKNVRKDKCIYDVDKNHTALRDWNPENLGRKDGRDELAKVQEIKRLYKSPQVFCELLKLETKTQLVDSNYIDNKLIEYIMEYGGLHGKEVCVDPFLASSLFGKKEQPSQEEKIAFKDIRKRLYSKLQIWHSIDKIEKDGTVHQIVNKGEPSNISLNVEKQKGRIYTVITGMENFGFQPQTLSDTLQKRMKTACFVTDMPGKTSKKKVIMQGDWITKRAGSHYLPSYFKEEGIPAAFITTANAVKKK